MYCLLFGYTVHCLKVFGVITVAIVAMCGLVCCWQGATLIEDNGLIGCTCYGSPHGVFCHSTSGLKHKVRHCPHSSFNVNYTCCIVTNPKFNALFLVHLQTCYTIWVIYIVSKWWTNSEFRQETGSCEVFIILCFKDALTFFSCRFELPLNYKHIYSVTKLNLMRMVCSNFGFDKVKG